jgi:ATP-binding cassette, subfamily C, bacterial
MALQNNIILKFFYLLKEAFSQYKWQIVLMAVLSFFSGILEGIGITAIIPVFSIMSGDKASDVISRAIAKFFELAGFHYTVKYLLIFMAFLFMIKAALLFFSQYITVKITSDYEKDTRFNIFRLMLESKWPFLLRQKVGYLDQILTTDINVSSALLKHISTIILIAANLMVYSFLVINISFVIAILALALGGSVFLIFKPLFYKNRAASAEMADQHKRLAHFVNESVTGMKSIKSLLAEGGVLFRGLEYFDRMKNLRMRVNSLKNFTNAALQPLAFFFVMGIFAFFYKTSAFNFASFAVIVYAVNRVFANIQFAQSEVHMISSSVPHLLSILSYQKETLKNKEVSRGDKKFIFNGGLEFRNVGFAYNEHREALSGVNLVLKKGEMLGLIGPSGAGKTTVVDLLLRLLEPERGEIMVDGVNAINISSREWRMNIGYVSQDIFLINDTIANNIKFYDSAISDEDMIEAAKIAHIYDFIKEQPDGFSAIVGERGMQLSGGQRQRIVLARVLARHPKILILDEATSALDNESEILIQKAIESMKGKITVLAIAHRLSTVLRADKLLVLENGKIIEEGSPQTLLRDKKSYFYQAYNLRQ